MALEKIFGIAGSALTAQQVRLNVTASNLANANQVANSPDTVYHAKYPIFQAVLNDHLAASIPGAQNVAAGVRVSSIMEDNANIQKRFQPGHPDADANGYVYATNVNPIEEMANMMSASRDYQTNIEMLNTSKELLAKTLDLLNT